MLKEVREKAEKTWTLAKKTVVAMSAWGLVFSLVTIARLGVAFDYDDTLVHSSPAYAKAFANSTQPFSPQFWAIVNNSYEMEQPKYVAQALAWTFRLFGFRVAIIAARPATEGDALKKEWRRLAPRGFYFSGDKENKHLQLQNGNYVLYFGDSDSDIAQARMAKVYPIRVKRGRRSSYKEDYHPGTLGEVVVPLSDI